MGDRFDRLLQMATASENTAKPPAEDTQSPDTETENAIPDKDAPEQAASPTEQPVHPTVPSDEEENAEAENAENAENTEDADNTVNTAPKHAKQNRKKRKNSGCARKMIAFILILCFCIAATYFIVVGFFDYVGLNKSDMKIDVEVPKGATTEQIAALLQENELIEHPWMFRLYSKLSRKEGNYQAGTYSLSANMGYSQLSTTIVLGNPRETVTVTIPEGFTVDQIAKRLEEKNVCTIADFYNALLHETYEYDFFSSIPQASDGGVYEGRIYRLEGYLFPDTYEFYTESGGKTVINKFLAAFDQKMTTAMRSAMQAQGLTMDEVVIMASIAQKEAVSESEMPKVTRILYNRLSSDYTRLECDSTAGYVANRLPNIEGMEIVNKAYDTYQRSGLPAGPICNPSLAALQAAITPSTDEYIGQCYFFANDSAGNTYYSKTFAQHEAVCRRYHIGAYR